MISISRPTASAIAGSAEIDDGAPSSWRPPWLETTTASAPSFTAVLASSASRIPLMMSFPGQRGIELLVGPLCERRYVIHALHVAGKIAEGLALTPEDAEDPLRLRRN